MLPCTPDHYLEKELSGLLTTGNPLAQFAIEAGNDGLWYWDLQEPEHIWISPKFWKALHIDPEGMPHTRDSLLAAVVDHDLAKSESLILDDLVEAGRGYDQVLRFKNGKNETTHFRCRGLLLKDADNRPHRMLGILRDLTSIASRGAYKEASASDPASMNSDLQQFIYSMSHDMVSPLRTASSALIEVQHALADGDIQDAQALTDMCRASVERMLVLLADMRSYFLHTEGTETSVRPVSSLEMACAVCDDLDQLIAEKQATVEIDCAHPLVAHPSQLRVVLQNFTQNAIKFGSLNGPAKVQIRTEALPEDGKIRLSVTDNGLGIPLHHLDGVFEPFTRLHLQHEVPGSGLGLSICRKIAENLGADIGAETLPEGGCRFFLDIEGAPVS